jgi:phage protein D
MTASIAPEFASVFLSHIDQTDESDSAFISRIAEDAGGTVKVANGQLIIMQPLSGMFPDGTPLPVIEIRESDIINYRMRLAERAKYGKVVAKYYDIAAAQELEVSVGDKTPTFTLRETFANAETARARATAKLREIESGTRTLTLEIIGNPTLSAESRILITVPDISGEWIIKSVRHNLSSSGYKTNIEASKL